MSNLRMERIGVGAKLATIAAAVNRTPSWLSLVERGKLSISSSMKCMIRKVIALESK